MNRRYTRSVNSSYPRAGRILPASIAPWRRHPPFLRSLFSEIPTLVQDTDTGSGLDEILQLTREALDTGTGTESVDRVIQVDDTGAGAEASSIGLLVNDDHGKFGYVKDDFNRVDTSQPPDGWIYVAGANWFIDNNRVTTSGAFGADMAFDGFVEDDVEAFIEISVLTSSGTQENIMVDARKSIAASTFYRCRYSHNFGDGQVFLEKYIAGTPTNFGSADVSSLTGSNLTVGDAIGIRCNGTTIEAWVRRAGIWYLALQVTDSSITAADYTGIASYAWGSTPEFILDNFGAGVISDVPVITENALVQIPVSASDSGSGTDAAFLTISVSDTGSDTEEITDRKVTRRDYGTTAIYDTEEGGTYGGFCYGSPPVILGYNETGAISQVAVETGTGVDEVSQFTRQLPDTGSGTEAESLAAAISGTDTGVGVDAAAIAFSIGDTGSGAEEIPTFVREIQDAGAGVDTASLSGADNFVVNDEGTSVENISSLSREIQEAGTGTDEISAFVRAASETGTGSDEGAPNYAISDSGTGTDTASVSIGGELKSGSDVGSGTDTGTLTVTLTGSESGTGTENSVLLIAVFDSGLAVEVTTLNAIYTAGDSGVGADNGTLGTPLIVDDFGTGVDMAFNSPTDRGNQRSILISADGDMSKAITQGRRSIISGTRKRSKVGA